MECLAGNVTAVNGTSNSTRAGRRSSGPDDKALTALFAGQMQFSVDLFKTVYNTAKLTSVHNNNKTENIFLSPMSVYSALLLAYFGSSNRTEEQLAQVLGFRDMDKVSKTDGVRVGQTFSRPFSLSFSSEKESGPFQHAVSV